LLKFAKDEQVQFKPCKRGDDVPITYTLIGDNGSSNYVLKKLRNLHVLNNKHIPLIYKSNSRDIRLKVLAGLIDSDGHYSSGGYDIIQKLKVLAYDIQDLCRSLGYACYTKLCKKGCMYKGEYREGDYYRMSISGDNLTDIPVLLKRKEAQLRLQIKNPLVTGFTIIPKNLGDYYGFTVDGNGRCVLGNYRQ
jgi:hypothetical protein